jgi:methanogenic corrinoid protein MtbC1
VDHAEAAHLRRALDRCLAQRDKPQSVRLALEAVREGGLDILDLYDLVLVPLLVDTGAHWQLGATAVWEEHLGSATVRTIIESLYVDVLDRSSAIVDTGRTALLACPPQEQHDLGLRMLADRFTLAGWNTVFLGADTPVDEICAASSAVGAEIVVLSASTHFNRVVLRRVVDRVRDGTAPARVLVGGPAFAIDKDWPAAELFDHAELGLRPPTTPEDV